MGAEARNLLHAAFRHEFPLRGTSDVDIGLATSDWETHDDLASAYTRTGSNGIRYRIEGFSVDVMPFGGVEDPAGITVPPLRGEELVVFGFRDVFDDSELHVLPSGHTIRIPTAAGYAVLKMRAFIDRSAYGEDKDAQDLAVAAFWYQQDPLVQDRLAADRPLILEELGFDGELAAAFLLGADVASILGADDRADLRRRWSAVDCAFLERYFGFGGRAPSRSDLERRRAVLEQISRGFDAVS
ncbi:hypothetical protein [Rathayibacter festucae]|uniref:hypothetical protein n=1 Tax=Rathayibacter festucae TaxID=110937 RepID=UPI002A6A13DF|nr:hypothetical protein [Rathayibacter festucae]MDY0915060.1 hypothetical protein [Rathayibacter festucae]